MSIYSCVDKIQQIIDEPHTGFRKYLLPFIRRLRGITDEQVRQEREFLENIKARLEAIGEGGYKESKENNLALLIQDIQNYKAGHIGLNPLLEPIINDLTIVKDGRRPINQSDVPNPVSGIKLSPSSAVEEQYKALLNSRLLVNKLVQAKMKELGNSPGE